MVAAVTMTDVSRQRRFSLSLDEDGQMTSRHTVGQAVERYVDEIIDPDDFHRQGNWWAYSRGVRLDSKARLQDLAPEDDAWLVMPEVTAG